MQSGAKKIPNNLIFFWHDKKSLPDQIRRAVDNTVAASQGARIVFADDGYMYDFIESHYDNDTLAQYKRIRVPASRSDVARLMLLYEFGGLYLDAAMETLTAAHSIVDDDADLLFVRRDDLSRYAKRPDQAHVINGIVGAAGRCDLIKEAIEMVLDNLRTCRYDNVWYATGAHSLNVLLERHGHRYRIEILRFSELSGKFFVYRRVPGVSNAWVVQQRYGILSPPASNSEGHSVPSSPQE